MRQKAVDADAASCCCVIQNGSNCLPAETEIIPQYQLMSLVTATWQCRCAVSRYVGLSTDRSRLVIAVTFNVSMIEGVLA